MIVSSRFSPNAAEHQPELRHLFAAGMTM